MGKADNGQAIRLLEIFLAGYREAAATIESVGGEASVQPIHPLASILEEASTAQAQIRQTLEECRRVAVEIKSLPKDEQEVARVELQKNVRHLLTWCDAISDQARTSSSPEPRLQGKRQKVEVEKKEDTDEKVPPQTEKHKKRSHRR